MVVLVGCARENGGSGISANPVSSDRLFLDLSLEYIDTYELEVKEYGDTPVGGLSALTFDRVNNIYYAISDDRSNRAPSRFYTLTIDLSSTSIDNVEITNVTTLKQSNGEVYPPNAIDGEGLAISPRGTLFLSSEGDVDRNIAPFIGEYDRSSGKQIAPVPLPQRFLPDENKTKGIRNNLGFEPLAVGGNALAPSDPFRLFTATESSLAQDGEIAIDQEAPIRLLHYVINPIGSPVLISENIYPLTAGTPDLLANGLTELAILPQEGYLLSLERTFSFFGAGAKIYQVVIADATDTSSDLSLAGIDFKPVQKQLLVDLSTLGIELDNLEGMTVGPTLPDGSSSLLLISDDNFSQDQVTQIMLFKLKEN